MRRAFLALCLCGCALPTVSAGTFLPAGDLERGQWHASVSFEAGRVLAGPSDIHDQAATPREAQQWEVSTWFSSDASLRWQAFSRVAFEVQVKLTNPIVPFAPTPVGGALGARIRLLERTATSDLALELGPRVVGVAVEESISRTQDTRSQTDKWDYRALGFELPLVGTWRINPIVALTASPFARVYYIRAWHTIEQGLSQTEAALNYTPVLSGGFGLAACLTMGPVEISPGLAVELATRPGPNQPTHVLFEPGLSLGTRF